MPVNSPSIDLLMQHPGALDRCAFSLVTADLVQNDLVAAWQQMGTFNGRSSLGTWLMGILKFKAINHFRRPTRTPEPWPPEMMRHVDSLSGSW